jgi:hypothetical protein
MPLEYCRLILSWPAVTLYLGLGLLWVLRKPLAVLAKMKVSGAGIGLELESSQAARSALIDTATSIKPEEGPSASAPEQSQPHAPASGSGTAQLTLGAQGEGIAGTPATSHDAAAARSEARRAARWEFTALNSLLVERTKLLLDKIIEEEGMTVGEIESVYAALLPEFERLAMVRALLNHRLVVLEQQGLIVATPKGRRYAEYRKSLVSRLVGLGVISPAPDKPSEESAAEATPDVEAKG